MAGSTQTGIPSQLGRTAVVTGATGGLGYETALALARAGAEVILTGRDDRKGQSAIEKISREVPDAKVKYESLDLASLVSIADFAQRMHSRKALDLLINNAGVMALPRRQTTADGFEMQFGTKLPGSLCTHCSANAAVAPGKRAASCQCQQSGAPNRVHRFRRSAGSAGVLAMEGVWAIQARDADVCT